VAAAAGEVQRVRQRWNNAVLAIAAALWFIPMVQFWMRFFPPLRPFAFDAPAPSWTALLFGTAACLTPFLLPRSYFRPRRFERPQRYRALGIRVFRYLAPDGDWVNGRVRRVDPGYRVIRTRNDVAAHIRGSNMGERMHLSLLIAGLITAWFSTVLLEPWFAAWITIGNVIFNLGPILHQRFKRARLRLSLARGPTTVPELRSA
jgi:polyferredoxin